MGVFRKFESGDIEHAVIQAAPRIIAASGNLAPDGSILGWRSNVGASASLSLYEGVRSRRDVRAGDIGSSGISIYPIDGMDTHSIDGVIFISGSYPATGSMRMVKVRPNTFGGGSETTADWYEEHYSPIGLLFDYYSRISPDTYFTGSYDYYSLYFSQTGSFRARAVNFSGTGLPTVTSSFTVEAWLKPTSVQSSTRDFVLMSQRARWKLFITGSTGRLAFTDFSSTVTSSYAPPNGAWTHVSLVVAGGSASFYIGRDLRDSAPYTGSLATFSGKFLATASFLTLGAEQVVNASSVVFDQGFRGYMFETRVWDYARTSAQISGAYARSLRWSESGSVGLRHYARFNDGPLGNRHGFIRGSGTYDHALSGSGFHGQLSSNFTGSNGPQWQPNDNTSFVVPKCKVLSRVDMMKAVHIPSMFYGRQITTGSVLMVDNTYISHGIQRVLMDDGRGGLYLSGSSTRRLGSEDYRGIGWNRVGSVFYVEGIIMITDPSMLDFGSDENLAAWDRSSDLLQVRFDGSERINTKIFNCRLDMAQGNASNNPTFSRLDDNGTPDPSDDRLVLAGEDNTTYVTAVGLYNERRELVAVAKIAQPIRKREKDRETIRLRYDF